MKDDADRLRAWASGDAAAGRRLCEDNFNRVRRFFRTKVPESDAEDLIQSTFAACLEAASRFRGDSSFQAFLMGIARNLLLRHLRDKARSARFDPLTHSVEDAGVGPIRVVEAAQERRRLLQALRQLPMDDQIALELYYWEGLGLSNIAQVLGISPTAAKSRLFRARRVLAERIATITSNPDERWSSLESLTAWRTDL